MTRSRILRILVCVPFMVCFLGLGLSYTGERVLHISEGRPDSFLANGKLVLVRGDYEKYTTWCAQETYREIPQEYHPYMLVNIPPFPTEPKHILQIAFSSLKVVGRETWFGLFSTASLGQTSGNPLINIFAVDLGMLTGLFAIFVLLVLIQYFLNKRRKERWRRIPACMSCGYNLTGTVSHKCPECGTTIPPEAHEKLTAITAAPTQQNPSFCYNAAKSTVD